MKQPAPMTGPQAAYIGKLAEQLGYGNVYDMWREYGYLEQTIGGERPRPVSKLAASSLIGKLKARTETAGSEI